MGKVPGGIAKAAKKYNKTVIALVGMIKDENISFGEYGIDACFHIIRQPMSLREAMDTQMAEKNLMMTAEQVFRLIGRI